MRGLERWRAAAARLGLSEPATQAGALLLGAEIDDSQREALLGEHAAKIAPRRADVLAAMSGTYERETALAGLVALEARGVAGPLRQYAGPWIAAELELDPRVRQHCVGALPESGVAPACVDVLLPRIAAAVRNVVGVAAREPQSFVVIVRGRPGSGRDTVLRALLAQLAAPEMTRTVFELRQSVDPLDPELSGAVAVWDARRADPGPDDYDIARRWLKRSPHVALALLDRHQDAPEVDGRLALRVDVDPVSVGERRSAWARALDPIVSEGELRDSVADHLARRSQAGPGLAHRVVALAPSSEGGSLGPMIEQRLNEAVQPSALRGIVVEHPAVPLERVVLPGHSKGLLSRLVVLAESATLVDADGRVGVKGLFAGPSGTGKTFAARAIASELSRPLYRVDLAAVVSKWVGETEKNLRDAMIAAESAGAVLLFDEGDALFGKRGEVAKGTDRYANIEVAYLLQAIEAFDGIVIVTTNLRNNIDTAFERRFDVTVEFLPPDRAAREAIWRQELGDAGREIADQHFVQLARSADLHGGSIASAVRIARVLALRRGSHCVNEEELRVAIQGEFLKIGSTVQAAHWGRNGQKARPGRRR